MNIHVPQDSGIHNITMVTLVPAGWVPDRTTTGGHMPPQSLMISSDFWEALGCPATIEEFHKRVEDAKYRTLNTFEFRGIPTMAEM